MYTFLDAKNLAKNLREAVAARSLAISHSESLEIVAKQFGLKDWNTLSARIAAAATDNNPLVMPRDWTVTLNTNKRFYRAGLDPEQPGTVLLESRFQRGSDFDLSAPDNFASIMQSVRAEGMKGRRFRLSAELRSDGADAASIWMRADGSPGHVLAFDNMLNRLQQRPDGALTGTRPWTACDIVLDVAENAGSVHYGFLLHGHGRMWGRNLRLQPVGNDVSPTAGIGAVLDTPSNLALFG
jgi:hypothetical protein